MSNTPLVLIDHLSKSFDPSLPPALDNITVTLSKGQMIGMAGPDGAGKTTLLRLIAGLLKPSQGSIKIDGYDTLKDATAIHEFIGYMPQKFGLYEDLSVMQNLNLYAELKGIPKPDKEAIFNQLLRFTDLAPFKDRLAGNLSGGMKQKLGLACALMKKPTLLLLDEPSVGVDPISRRELWKMVHALLAEGITVIWSTAYLDEAERSDTVLLLNGGKLLYQGPPAQLTTRMDGRKLTFEDAFVDMLGGGPQGPSPLANIFPVNTSTKQNVIESDHLTKKFGHFTAADEITLQVKKGEIFGLLGPNGAGKSTTFKMLCGLLKPTSGTAFVNGIDFQKAPGTARAHIGYMAQKFSLYGNLSTLQNLQFFAGIYNLSGREKRDLIDKMITIFDLSPYLDENADALPLGFKQRLALSCAVMHQPSVLFLDEPTSGVDPITRREFWGHIKGLVQKGITIMVTTHFMDEAEYCDRIALIYRSKIIKMGTPETLKAESGSATLEDAFIHLINNVG